MIAALGFLWHSDLQLKIIDIISSFASDLSIASCFWFLIYDIYMNKAEDDDKVERVGVRGLSFSAPLSEAVCAAIACSVGPVISGSVLSRW